MTGEEGCLWEAAGTGQGLVHSRHSGNVMSVFVGMCYCRLGT